MARRAVSKRRILFVTCSVGGSHARVANAVTRYLKEHHPRRVETRTVDLFDEVVPELGVLARLGHQRVDGFAPEYSGLLADAPVGVAHHPLITALADHGIAALRAILDEYRPDVAVATFSVGAAALCEARRSSSEFPIACILPDLSPARTWVHPGVDLSFVASRSVREDLVVRGTSWDRIVETGVPVDLRIEPGDRITGDRSSAPFTVFVGSDLPATGAFSDIVSQCCEAGLNVFAYSPGSGRRSDLSALLKRYEDLTVTGRLADAFAAMSSCHVMITPASGGFVSEALSAGLPLIVYDSVPGQEIGTIDQLVNWGACFAARDATDCRMKATFLAAHRARQIEMAEAMASLGRPGAARIVGERLLAL